MLTTLQICTHAQWARVLGSVYKNHTNSNKALHLGSCSTVYSYIIQVHALMRDEKEGRKKQDEQAYFQLSM